MKILSSIFLISNFLSKTLIFNKMEAYKLFWGNPTVNVGKTGVGDTMSTTMEPFGEIVENSTTFRVEEGTTESKKNEHGHTIKTKSTKGDAITEYDVYVLNLDVAQTLFDGDLSLDGKTLDTELDVKLPGSYSVEIFGDEGIGVRYPKSDTTARLEYTADGGLVCHVKHVTTKPAGAAKSFQLFVVE